MEIEICVDSTSSAIAAAENGAHRVELCSDLLEGGITPSYGLIKRTTISLKPFNCLVMVMIRPRGGDFCYSEEEMECMKLDIEACKTLGVHGVVFGVLSPDGTVNVEQTRLYVFAREEALGFNMKRG
jgi:copper homeostasis protein